jgi:hypothetical protein
VEHQRLDVEPACARRLDLAVDDVEVAIVHIRAALIDLQPRSPVEHAAAPAADFEYLARPADVAQRPRLEAPAVIQREVPVAVRPVRPLRSRSAQADSDHAGQPRQPVGDVIEEGALVHHATLTGAPGAEHPRFRLAAHRRSPRAALTPAGAAVLVTPPETCRAPRRLAPWQNPCACASPRESSCLTPTTVSC